MGAVTEVAFEVVETILFDQAAEGAVVAVFEQTVLLVSSRQ